MRRHTYIFFSLAIASLLTTACSTHKNTARSRFWQSFTARYNTYYNGSQAYIDGSLEKEKGNKDNFTEQLPLFTVGNKQSRTLGKSHFDRTIEKMEKTIKQHSIKAKPEWRKSRRKTARDREWLGRREYNPFLWKAWLLMGKAQYQKGEFEEAAATFSYMSRLYQTQPLQSAVARAWLARCYLELDWLYDAEDVIRNMSRDSMHYRAQNDWDAAYAHYYLKSGELEKALPYLRQTIRHEHRKTQKAREWFLMGQLHAALGHRAEAYKSYQRAIRQNPPYELEFNARIAQTEVMASGNARKMIGRLKRMARSDNNKDYLDQVYYAIGNIHLMQRDTAAAIAAYEKGAEKATRSGIEKGVLLLKLGNLYWQKEKYNDAQRCYGQAIGLLDKERSDYEQLAARSKVLDELVPHTDAVHLQDSLQLLAQLPEKERLEAIDRVIEALKKKEKEERDKAREAEVEAALQKQGAVGNRSQAGRTATPSATSATMGNGQWYFYNPMAVNQGKQTFQKQWGRRDNADDWRRLNKTVVGSLDTPDDADTGQTDADAQTAAADSLAAAQTTGGVAAADSIDALQQLKDSLAADPHNREYYLAQIPFTDDQKAASDLIIMDALYHAGVIFKDKLDNLGLAEKQLTRLTTQYPTFEQTDQAWYHLYLLYARRGDDTQAQNCLARLQADYPDSEWTILLSDPYFAENARFGEHIEDSIYAATYDAFKSDRHDVIRTNAKLSEERFPLGDNRAKFIFIHGLSLLNQGDARGCVAQLKTVVEKYPQSEVSPMAGMIIKGVQEGRQLYGGKFDLDAVWNRRDMSLEQDSTATDTLSADRDVNFLFLLIYQPDSLTIDTPDGHTIAGENQLLYEMARFNFSNFLVRNFDLEIDRQQGFSRMMIRGFLNFDEALQYARRLYDAESLSPLVRRCRSLVISEHNLQLIGTRYSYADYDAFYEETFLPIKISDEELLDVVPYVEPADPDDDAGDEGQQTDDGGDEPAAPVQNQNGGFDFDPDFW